MVIGFINWAQGNRIMSSFYHFAYLKLHTMTRNALSMEAVGRRANNALLPHSIKAWDSDCWSNKVIEEQLEKDPPQTLNRTAWVVGLASSQIDTPLPSCLSLSLSLSFRLELIPPRGGVSHADPPSPLVSII